MSKKLLLLNLALAAGVFYAGNLARENWLEARQRADVVLGRRLPPAPPPPLSPLPKVEPASAAVYAGVAQQTLFSPDRNPTVVVEVAPEPPMPPLPALYGVMDLGEGPLAMMAEKAGARSRMYRPGESVGPFKLVAVNGQTLVLEWSGKRVEKRINELIAGSAPPAEASQAANAPVERQAPVVQAPVRAKAEPGDLMGDGVRGCQRGDDSPAGTVANGFRKVVSASPFGQICRWERVN